MIERLDVRNTPLFEALEEIMGEAREKFMYLAITPERVHEIENFINDKLQEEIAAGRVRDTFVTPNNRVARFEAALIDINPEDATELRVHPLWVYEKDNIDLWEGTVG